MLSGVEYDRNRRRRAAHPVDGQARVLDVDTIVVCAGRTPGASCWPRSSARGPGDADRRRRRGGGVDAKRAIEQGSRSRSGSEARRPAGLPAGRVGGAKRARHARVGEGPDNAVPSAGDRRLSARGQSPPPGLCRHALDVPMQPWDAREPCSSTDGHVTNHESRRRSNGFAHSFQPTVLIALAIIQGQVQNMPLAYCLQIALTRQAGCGHLQRGPSIVFGGMLELACLSILQIDKTPADPNAAGRPLESVCRQDTEQALTLLQDRPLWEKTLRSARRRCFRPTGLRPCGKQE